MNVLIVSHHALPHVGGVEVLVDLEVRGLVEAGHHVVQVTSKSTTTTPPAQGQPPFTIIQVPAWHVLERRLHLTYPIFSPRLLPALWREVGRCDVLHVHGYIFMSSFFALIIGRLHGKPCVLTDHGGIQQYHSRIITLCARLAAHTIGRISAHLASKIVTFNSRITHLLERLAGTKSKSQFLPNPVDYSLFQPPTPAQRQAAREQLGWTTDRPKVLFVGRFIPDKGIDLLLNALDPAYDLVFCGSGDVSSLGQLPRSGIEYLPPRPQPELVKLYHAADLLVLPSLREGFPLVVQEALTCGLKVVMSYDEGYEPYRHLPGLRFCERQPEAIRRAILEMLQSTVDVSDAAARDALREMCPPLDEWVRRLYGPVEQQLQAAKSAESASNT